MWTWVREARVAHKLEYGFTDQAISQFIKTWVSLSVSLKPCLSEEVFDFCRLVSCILKAYWNHGSAEPFKGLLKRSLFLMRLPSLNFTSAFCVIRVVCEKALKFLDINCVLSKVDKSVLSILIGVSELLEHFLDCHAFYISKMSPLLLRRFTISWSPCDLLLLEIQISAQKILKLLQPYLIHILNPSPL